MVFVNRKGCLPDNYRSINLYRYGVLWKTLTVEKGGSVTVGSCDISYSDDTFFGWSISSASTTRTYTSASSIKPTENMNLYAVFSYVENALGTKSLSCSGGAQAGSVQIALPLSGTITFTGSASGGGTNGSWTATPTIGTVYTNGTITVLYTATLNGSSVTGSPPVTRQASAGNIIALTARGSSNSYNGGACTITVTYPAYVDTTKYRVEAHV